MTPKQTQAEHSVTMPTTPAEAPKPTLTRRKLLQQTLSLGMIAGGGLVLAACGSARRPSTEPVVSASADSSAEACADQRNSSDLTSAQAKALQYVDQSPQPGKHCGNCRLYHAGEGTAAGCGRCDALPFAVAAEGYCRAWTAA